MAKRKSLSAQLRASRARTKELRERLDLIFARWSEQTADMGARLRDQREIADLLRFKLDCVGALLLRIAQSADDHEAQQMRALAINCMGLDLDRNRLAFPGVAALVAGPN